MKTAKSFVLTVFLSIFAASLFAAPDLTGIWKMRDDSTRKDIFICLYLYEGMMYGRILRAYDIATGQLVDEMDAPVQHAVKLAGDPAFCGLDLVYSLTDIGNSWYGCIIDPETGDEYSCNIWKDGAKLKVRAELKGLFSFLGRELVWEAVPPAGYPEGFVPPDASLFTPVVPKRK